MAKKIKKKPNEDKNDVGRPSRYSQRFCKMLEDHMEQGGAFETFGAVIRVCYKTLHNWTDTHEEFLQSKQLGEVLSFKFYEDLAKAQMTGTLRRVKSETTLLDGTKKREFSPTRGDSRTWGITMRSRFRKFGYANSLEVTGKGGGPIRTKDVSDMTDEEMDKALEDLEKMGV